MAIIRMISRDPGEFREFQSRMATVGKIRLGTYNGRYPEKLSTFRFTSEDGDKVRAAATAYGGTAEQWTPQGAKTPQWEVISDAKAIPVYIVNGQSLEPWYEAWAGGRTCVRRCDGVTNKITDTPCVCIPADGSAPRIAAKELCKPTIRVQVMLAEIPGLGSWLMESHGENACAEISTFGPFIAAARTQVPAVLRLREENRREWNPDKKGGPGFESKSFYVPWFDISAITMQQVAIGGDALTQALRSAGGSAALSAGPAQAAIEARPVSAPVPPPAAPAAPAFDIEALRPAILADIEAQTTVEGLDAIRDKLKARGVNDQQVIDAWSSKMAAVTAAAETTPRPYRVLVTGSRTWTDVPKLNEALDLAEMTHRGRVILVHGACPTGADALADAWARAKGGIQVERHPADWSTGKGAGFARNQAMVDTRPDVVLAFIRDGSKGATHCADAAEKAGLKVLRFVDDTPVEVAPPERQPVGMPLQEYRVGDTVNVGGIEFTKISESPFDLVEGDVEDVPGAVALPDVPAGDHDVNELYSMIMTGASTQTPPLTTKEVNALICRVLGISASGKATGHQLARVRAGLKAGIVAWR